MLLRESGFIFGKDLSSSANKKIIFLFTPKGCCVFFFLKTVSIMEKQTKLFIEFFLYEKHRQKSYTLKEIKQFLNLKKSGERRLSDITSVFLGLGILKFKDQWNLVWFDHAYIFWGIHSELLPSIKCSKRKTIQYKKNTNILWTEYIVCRLLELKKLGFPKTTITELYNWICMTYAFKKKTYERRISDILNIACGTGLVGRKLGVGRKNGFYWWIGIKKRKCLKL